MNLLFIYNNPINPNAGGIARITYTLGKLFREKGHTVFFLSLKHNLSQSFDNQFQESLPSNKIYDAENIRFLISFIKSHQIDIILNQSSINRDITRLLQYTKKLVNNIKIVTCFHTSILSQAKNAAFQEEYRLKKHNKAWLFALLKNKLISTLVIKAYILKWRRFYDYILSVCDYAVLLNNGQVDELRQMVGHEYDCKLRVITNCVPDDGSPRIEKTNSIVWCGAFNIRIKRPDLMLLIWKSLYEEFPNWQLYMVGDGQDLEEMQRYAKSLKIKNVIFTGRISPKDIFSSSKITCVTSTHETFSLVAVEAMTAYMPIVAFNSFTMAEELIFNDENGYLIDDFSIEEYTEKLRLLMINDSKRSQMGDNAHKVSENYRPNYIYENWKSFFEHIL